MPARTQGRCANPSSEGKLTKPAQTNAATNHGRRYPPARSSVTRLYQLEKVKNSNVLDGERMFQESLPLAAANKTDRHLELS
jgi:hypothetical protein